MGTRIVSWPDRLAVWVSVLGHPLVTLAVFPLLVAIHEGPAVLPLRHALLIIASVIAPLTFWNLRQTRLGAYSNFDVSVRTERTSMYLTLLALMTPVTLILYHADISWPVRATTVCLTAMFAAAWLINRYVKLSLHTAVSVFLAMTLVLVDARAGAMLGGLAVVVALSRLKLRRHTVMELMIGAAVGVATGLVLLLVLEI